MTVAEVQAIIKEKVADKLVPCHEGEKHRYELVETSEVFDSITTKLGLVEKEHLRAWAVKMALEWMKTGDRWESYLSGNNETLQGAILAHTDRRDEAGNIGTRVHDFAELYVNQKIPIDMNEDGRVIAGCRSIVKFFDEHPDIVPVASELLVCSKKLNSAGTLDLLVMNKGKLEVFDYKTSNSVDRVNYSAQVAAYAQMFKEMTGLKIHATRIIHISKDYAKVDIYTIKNIAKALQFYKAISKAYDLREKRTFDLIKEVKKNKLYGPNTSAEVRGVETASQGD